MFLFLRFVTLILFGHTDSVWSVASPPQRHVPFLKKKKENSSKPYLEKGDEDAFQVPTRLRLNVFLKIAVVLLLKGLTDGGNLRLRVNQEAGSSNMSTSSGSARQPKLNSPPQIQPSNQPKQENKHTSSLEREARISAMVSSSVPAPLTKGETSGKRKKKKKTKHKGRRR